MCWVLIICLRCGKAQQSAMEGLQVMLQAAGQQPDIMSIQDAANQGYFIMLTASRIVFRTSFGQPHASITMVWRFLLVLFLKVSVCDSWSSHPNWFQVNGVAVEVIQCTVFFRLSWMVVMVDLVAACSLGKHAANLGFDF